MTVGVDPSHAATPAAVNAARSYPDCREPAQGRVAVPVFLDATAGGHIGFVIVRPLGTNLTRGAPCRVHHIHAAVDLKLLTADVA